MNSNPSKDRTLRPILPVVLLLLLACAARPPVPLGPTDPSNPIKRIAVLPLRNDTNDVDGPGLVQEKMASELVRRAYSVMDIRESGRILRDALGINLGGQLDMATPRQLGEALEVDAVLYGTLMDFDETTTGVYTIRKVRAVFKLVNTATGQIEWERGLGVRSEIRMAGLGGDLATILGRAADPREKEAPWVTIEHIVAGENYRQSLAIGLGTTLLTRLFGIQLDREATALSRLVTDNLRWGPGGF